MRIAIPCHGERKVAGHAGHARHWLIFDGERGGPARLAERLELAPEQVFHHYDGTSSHPLDGIGALLTRSAGPGFIRKMHRRGVDAVVTAETNAQKAATDYLAGTLASPPPAGLMQLFCRVRDMFSRSG